MRRNVELGNGAVEFTSACGDQEGDGAGGRCGTRLNASRRILGHFTAFGGIIEVCPGVQVRAMRAGLSLRCIAPAGLCG